MNIVVLTSGGDAPGMNAFLAELEAKAGKKNEIYAAMEGFKGLINDNFLPLESLRPKVFEKRAGTVIKTSRCPEFRSEEGLNKAVKNLKSHNVDCVVIVGGNGSLRGAKELHEKGINVIFVPGSIDNDMDYTDYSIGFDTAVFQASRVISDVMPSMESFTRSCLFEVMGREEDDIAKEVANRVDADYRILKKSDIDEKKISKIIHEKYKLGKSAIIIVRENLINLFSLKDSLNEKLKMDLVRAVIVGYVQRGGFPTVKEIKNAQNMAKFTIKDIKKQEFNRAIGLKNNKIFSFSILEI